MAEPRLVTMTDSRALRSAVALPLSAVLLVSASPAVASHHGWNTASNISRDLVVGAGLGLPLLKGDWHGLEQSALSIGVAGAATQGLKYAFPEERPDGSSNKSFPSGHTSMSFAAAASLHKRYGWQVGIPAYVLASFTGVARVKADKHYVHDVLAGAVLGEASGWLLTRRHDSKVQWLPWAGTREAGVALTARF